MLIIALVLAVIGLAALVFAVVTSNELVAWVCIGASVIGVVLLIIDALQERRRRDTGTARQQPAAGTSHDESPGFATTDVAETEVDFYEDYPEDAAGSVEGHAAARANTGVPLASRDKATAADREPDGPAEHDGGQSFSEDHTR